MYFRCRLILSSLKSEKPRPLERLPDYDRLVENVRDNQKVKTLRNRTEKPCGCELCRLGSAATPTKNLRNSDGPVESDFLTEGPIRKKPGRPSANPDAKSCGFCQKKDIVGHDCNASAIIQSISEGTCQIIATEIMKGKMIEIKSKDMSLKSKLGRPLHVTINNCDHLLPGSSKPSKSIISSSTLMKLRTRLNLSGRKAILAGQIFGADLKMKLEPHFKDLLIKKGHELDEFFDIIEDVEFDSYEFEKEEEEAEGEDGNVGAAGEGTSKKLLHKGKQLLGKGKNALAKGKKVEEKVKKADQKEKKRKKVLKKVKKTFICCNNVEGLVALIKQKRGYDPDADDNLLIKLGLDSGRGFLKLCLTIEELKNSEEFTEEKKKMPRHQQKFKDGGVKKLIILGLVEGCLETYDNVKVLMDICGINNLSFSKSFSVDLKMDNLLLGEYILSIQFYDFAF